MTTRALLVLIFLVVAGCSTSASPRAEDPPAPAPPVVTLSRESFLAGAAGVAMHILFPSGGIVRIDASNGRADVVPDAAAECGLMRVGLLPDEEDVFAGAWAESAGRALTVSAADESRQVDGAGTAGRTDGFIHPHVNATYHDLPVEPGGRLALRIGVGVQSTDLYKPRITVADLPSDAVVTILPFEFRCGTGLSDFAGTVVQGGAFFGPTLVRDAVHSEVSTTGGDAAFVWVRDPRRGAATCDIAIEGPEAPAVRDVRRNDHCFVEARAGAGEWRFVIHEAATAGPSVGWWLVGDPAAQG